MEVREYKCVSKITRLQIATYKAYITSLVIYGLGGVETHMHPHIHSCIESDFKKPGTICDKFAHLLLKGFLQYTIPFLGQHHQFLSVTKIGAKVFFSWI